MPSSATQRTSALLDVRLFGTPEVLVCDEPLRPLHSRRGLWLLAILALNGAKPIDRLRLAGLLWPDSPDTTALHNLRQTLSDLRRALGPASGVIVSDTPRSLRLDPQCACVDLTAFDHAASDGTPDSLRRAAEMYRGPLLADCDEPWAVEARRAREEVYLDALERLARERAEAGDHGAAAHWLRLSVAADPYREPAHRSLMESLAATGERTAAMDVYRALRLRLHHDLNAQPEPETTALFRSLRSGGPAARAAPSAPSPPVFVRGLPATRTGLIGRDEAARHVHVLLQRNRLVTLMGAGGIGKTSLAIRVANDTEEEYDDGVVFVTLGALADPHRVPDVVREEAGLAGAHDSRDPATVVQEFFATRRCLLVLDNCEHLLSACAELVDSLLTRCPGLRILATSRHALGIGGETVWRVPSLDLPPEGQGHGTSDLSTYPAVALFVTRARAGEPAFRLTPANTAAVVDICRRLDGIPLAIELAAARVRSLPVLEISRRLCDDMNLLGGRGTGTVPRHHTLETAFRWSWELLTPAERAILGQLSVFAGGWTHDAAGEVCAGSGMRREDVVDLLASLVDKSLVIYEAESFDPDEESGPSTEPRYHLLEPIRQFAAVRLRESGGEDAAASRHLACFLAFAERGATGPFGPVTVERAKQLNDLKREHDNLRAALACAATSGAGRESQASLRLCRALAPFWFTQGHWTEGRRWLESAIADSDNEVSPLRAEALCAAGMFAANQGDHAEATRLFDLALAMFGELGDRSGQARALNGLGNIAYSRDDYAAATAHYGEGLSLARDADDAIIAARLLCNLGGVAQRQDESQVAAARYQEALAIYRANADMAGTGLALHGVGCALHAQGEYAAAREHYAQSLEIKRQLGTKGEVALLLTNLAHLAFEMGDLDTAAKHDEECLTIRRECGDQLGVAQALANLASIAAYRGEHARARKLCSESRSIYESHGARRGLSYLLDTMGRLALAEDDIRDARARFVESLRIRTEIGHRVGAIESLESIAHLEAVAHRHERAAILLAASGALRQQLSCPVPPFKQTALHEQLGGIRENLGDDAFEAARRAGSALAFDSAVAFALEESGD